ncbi:MAG: beta-N-acetylhexosaminidase [bacterium]|nr:beta-N-acetylhexosaminidase [bacterium]
MTPLQYSLLPVPQRLRLHPGSYDLARLHAYSCQGTLTASQRLSLEAELHDLLGRKLTCTSRPALHTITLRIDPASPPNKGPESYQLIISPTHLSLSGASPRAVFWGLQTLWQLRHLCGQRLPCLAIDDWPQFAWRGFSDDMSRRQISPLRDLTFTLRWLARFKLNVYQPYIEDIIFIDKYPLVGKNSGRFTRDEIAQLVATGQRYFIDIVPQFNSLSHQEHLLASPHFYHWRFQGNPETLDPRRPEVRRFLHDVYHQLFTQFPAPFFHMGLDEARGLLHHPHLFLKHANWLAQLVVDAGKTPLMWHDMFVPYDHRATHYSPALLQHLHPAVILNVWLYRMPDERVAFLHELVRYQRSFLLSPWIQSHFCGAARADAEHARLLVHAGQNLPGMLGVHNTTWNDNAILTDRALNWRSHAIAAALAWRGARSLDELQRAARASATFLYGLRSSTHLATLDAAAECGAVADTRPGGAALTLPLRLAHTVTHADLTHATKTRALARRLHARLLSVRAAATYNQDLLDHVLLGLQRIYAGAVRTLHAPILRAALQKNNFQRIAALAVNDVALLHRLRTHHASVYLHRYKAEGFECLDRYYLSCIAALEDLAWYVSHHRTRHADLCTRGFIPLDLSTSVNSPPRDLAPLLYGPVVHDNVPWILIDPATSNGNSLIWTGSSLWQTYPNEIIVPVNLPARELHVLHAAYGANATSPGSYLLVFSDGKQQLVSLRPRKDCADWWMPFGHTFGGGGALSLDVRRCRLACLTDPEFIQGHCLYHFHVPVRSRTPITHLVIRSGHADTSLIVAAITFRI